MESRSQRRLRREVREHRSAHPARAGQQRAAEDAAASARPKTRGECRGGVRPCPWVGCRYNLALEVDAAGTARWRIEEGPWELVETCALDVAERGAQPASVVASLLGLSVDRVRQIQSEGKEHLTTQRAALLGEPPEEEEDAA